MKCFFISSAVKTKTGDVAKELIISDYDSRMETFSAVNLFFFTAAIFYLLVHLFLIIGLRKESKARAQSKPLVSVIVAARNEERTIGSLIHCLLQQTYNNLEIIIVNDRSTDKTKEIIGEYAKHNSFIQQIDISNVPMDMPAKKNALRAGIEKSCGEVLCFTDADCLPPPAWIETLLEQFDESVGLVAGYSPYSIYEAQDLFSKLFYSFIEYEEFRAAVWSAGSIGMNLGWLCTGRNLAYRRSVYDELEGFEQIKMSVSGDDDLFLQLARRKTNWKIRYVISKNNFAPTLPPSNFKAFVEQRKRHFSAAKYFTVPMKLFFFAYHFANLLLFLSPIFFMLNILSPSMMAFCVVSKMLSDAVLFVFSCRIFNAMRFRHIFLFMELLYIFYNLFIGTQGLIRKFEWKPARQKIK